MIALVGRLRERAGRRASPAAGMAAKTPASRVGSRRATIPRWPATGLLIATRTGARVRVDHDSGRGPRAPLRDAGYDIVVCDDGLQHYRLARDIEIEVLDARRRYGNGLLMPAGPLREPLERAADCAFRVLNLGAVAEDALAAQAGLGRWPMRLEVQVAMPLQGGRAQPLAAFAGQRVHAVAGIGDPSRFFATLRDHRDRGGAACLPRPPAYGPGDFAFGSPLPVLMTDRRDAVKCRGFAQPGWHAVPRMRWLPEAFWVALCAKFAAPPLIFYLSPCGRSMPLAHRRTNARPFPLPPFGHPLPARGEGRSKPAS